MSERFVDHYLGYLLGQANHALYKDFDARVRAAGLSSIEWRVLATLHDSDPLPVSQLAHEVLSKQPTVTKLVQRMCEQGWLQLSADPLDQRRAKTNDEAASITNPSQVVMRIAKSPEAPSSPVRTDIQDTIPSRDSVKYSRFAGWRRS